MKNKKILITGGSGFAGSHLVEFLLNQSKHEINITAFGSNNEFIQKNKKLIKIHRLDLTNQEAVAKLIKTIKPDQIYHLASFSKSTVKPEDFKKVILNNFNLQLNLLNAVAQYSHNSRILHISSAYVYKPVHKQIKLNELDKVQSRHAYSASKLIQENLCLSYIKSYNLDIVIVRPFNHIGERQALGFVVPDFCQKIIKAQQTNKAIKVGNLQAIRDFTDVKDMVKAYYLLMSQGKQAEIYNVGSGHGITIKQLLEQLIQCASTEIKIDQKQNIDNQKQLILIADNSKIKKLGWQPEIALEKTLHRTFNYYKNKKNL